LTVRLLSPKIRSSLEYLALDTFDKIAAANNGLRDRNIIETITRISESHSYVTSVRNRAKVVLENLKKYRLQG
jgi:hypothetical protein